MFEQDKNGRGHGLRNTVNGPQGAQPKNCGLLQFVLPPSLRRHNRRPYGSSLQAYVVM